jgi:hypothetical protein
MAILYFAIMLITAHSRYALIRVAGVSTGFVGMMIYSIVFLNQYLLK